MNLALDKLINPAGFDARLDDMRILLDLEARCLLNKRLSVRQVITLQTLREFYPGSSARIRNELLMSDGNHEELLLFVINKEDTDLFAEQVRTEADDTAAEVDQKLNNPDLDP